MSSQTDDESRQQISRALARAPRQQLAPLAALVEQLDDIAGPPPGDSHATKVELDLAYRLGQLQASTITTTASRFQAFLMGHLASSG